MREELKKKILEAFIKDGFLEDDALTLTEYEEKHPDEGWDYDTLEEALLDYQCDEDLDESLKGDQTKQYDLGDIIMTNAFYSHSSNSVVRNRPHRILVITSVKNDDGIVYYRGFELSSQVQKSNKNNGYKNSLHIDSFNSILDRSRPGAAVDKEAILIVNDLVKFSSKDLSTSGSYKGHASNEFLAFVQKAYNNYKTGKDNSHMYWEI